MFFHYFLTRYDVSPPESEEHWEQGYVYIPHLMERYHYIEDIQEGNRNEYSLFIEYDEIRTPRP